MPPYVSVPLPVVGAQHYVNVLLPIDAMGLFRKERGPDVPTWSWDPALRDAVDLRNGGPSLRARLGLTNQAVCQSLEQGVWDLRGGGASVPRCDAASVDHVRRTCVVQ